MKNLGSKMKFMKQKIVLILPYFGKFDALFPVWLKSCQINESFDFLIFTDDKRDFDYPENVKVHYMEFAELKDKIQQLYDFKISLEQPYRLCNFKPAYGDIFQEYIKEYDYWGFCDNDVIFGNLRCLFPENLEIYDRIGFFGHLTLLRNTVEMRELYKYAGAYKLAFSLDEPLFFDEDAFSLITVKCRLKTYRLKVAELKPRIKQHITNDGAKNHVFVFQNNQLMRFYLDQDNSVKVENYAYIHFLKRPMVVPASLDMNQPLVIIPNTVINYPPEMINRSFIVRHNVGGVFWSYWKNSFKWKNFKRRLQDRLYKNKKYHSHKIEMRNLINEYKNTDTYYER